MDAVEEMFEARASGHSRRAVALWSEAMQMMSSPNGFITESVFSAIELTSRAIEEFTAAVNTRDFLLRYRRSH